MHAAPSQDLRPGCLDLGLPPRPVAKRQRLPKSTPADADFGSEVQASTCDRVYAGRRSFVVATSVFELYMTTRAGMTIAAMVDDELREMERGLAYTIAHGATPAEAALAEDDRTIWEGTTLVAVIRCNPAGDVVATLFAEDV